MIQLKKYLPLIFCTISILFIRSTVIAQDIHPADSLQAIIDSQFLDRISTLENQSNYKKSGDDHFMIVGLTTFGFSNAKTTTTVNGVSLSQKSNSFPNGDNYEFSPMLLWRHGTKVLAEFEPSFDGNTLGVNWADVSYYATPGLIIRGGYFVIPFGTYNKRLAAGWIDKLAGDPIGVADLPPSTDFGIEVEGGLPLGNAKWNYDVALTNGFQLVTPGNSTPGQTYPGELQNAGLSDNNLNKTLTARIGLLPFSNSSLEIGVSGLFGNVGDAGDSLYQSVKTNMYAFDLNYVNSLDPFNINIKAQYNIINVDKVAYADPNNPSNTYSFDNTTTTGFAQLSLRPISSNNNFVKNLELAFRYGNYITPKNSSWGANTNQFDIGLDYWLSWRQVLKFTYTTNKSTATSNEEVAGISNGVTTTNTYYLQYSIQL